VAESQKLHEEPPVAYLLLSVSNPAFFRDVELLCHYDNQSLLVGS
jgi:hypothetical protein